MLGFIMSLLISDIFLLLMGLYIRFFPNDYPEFHENHPFIPYMGLNLNFLFVKITNNNWGFIKKTTFKAFIGAIIGNTIFATALTLPFPQYDYFQTICTSTLLWFVIAFIYVIAKTVNYGE